MATEGPLLELREITVRFRAGRRWLTAVDRVSLRLGRGETLGLVGESGSGKSTLALVAVRALRPDSGRVLFDGVDITDLSESRLRPVRRRMQMVFQDPYSSLDPALPVGRAIAEPLRVHRLGSRGSIRTRVGELLGAVGLAPEVAGRLPGEFSGGQRQRISIARALALGPDLLIADEPVSALDVSTQAQIIALLSDIRQRLGLAAVFIAHDLALVYQVSDRIAVMYLGQVVEEGPTAEVVFRPQHPYTAALLSATPVPDAGPAGLAGRIVLHGDPPSALDPPTGCRFHTRCPIARDICATSAPPLEAVHPGHLAACHFAGEIGPVILVAEPATQ
jgi:oligopeptide/dipeptide ABC transporter ATP-binding protein